MLCVTSEDSAEILLSAAPSIWRGAIGRYCAAVRACVVRVPLVGSSAISGLNRRGRIVIKSPKKPHQNRAAARPANAHQMRRKCKVGRGESGAPQQARQRNNKVQTKHDQIATKSQPNRNQPSNRQTHIKSADSFDGYLMAFDATLIMV
jgi:hypothetical protein